MKKHELKWGEEEPSPFKIYYCKHCNRYTDVRFLFDKGRGDRFKSYCYKCGREDLEGIII